MGLSAPKYYKRELAPPIFLIYLILNFKEQGSWLIQGKIHVKGEAMETMTYTTLKKKKCFNYLL